MTIWRPISTVPASALLALREDLRDLLVAVDARPRQRWDMCFALPRTNEDGDTVWLARSSRDPIRPEMWFHLPPLLRPPWQRMDTAAAFDGEVVILVAHGWPATYVGPDRVPFVCFAVFTERWVRAQPTPADGSWHMIPFSCTIKPLAWMPCPKLPDGTRLSLADNEAG